MLVAYRQKGDVVGSACMIGSKSVSIWIRSLARLDDSMQKSRVLKGTPKFDDLVRRTIGVETYTVKIYV